MSVFTVGTDNGIAVVTIDLPGEPVNKLNAAVSDEFKALLERLATDGGILQPGDAGTRGVERQLFRGSAAPAGAGARRRRGESDRRRCELMQNKQSHLKK